MAGNGRSFNVIMVRRLNGVGDLVSDLIRLNGAASSPQRLNGVSDLVRFNGGGGGGGGGLNRGGGDGGCGGDGGIGGRSWRAASASATHVSPSVTNTPSTYQSMYEASASPSGSVKT